MGLPPEGDGGLPSGGDRGAAARRRWGLPLVGDGGCSRKAKGSPLEGDGVAGGR